MSPGHGPSLDIGTSGGLDFISSRGYPEIEFGYSGESEDDAISDDDDNSTSLDDEGPNGKSPIKNNLVRAIFLTISLTIVTAASSRFLSLYSPVLFNVFSLTVQGSEAQ